MTIKAIALDDEVPALDIIEAFCQMVEFIDLKRTFTKPSEALNYLQNFPVDLLFLDINMPSVNGIEFYQRIPQKTSVVFTTAYSEYAVEGFNLNAIDYLLKPFTFDRFLQAAEKAQQTLRTIHQSNENEFPVLLLRVNYNLVKINSADILYIEGLDDYLKIHLHNKKAVVVRMTIKTILEKLPQNKFVRVHRSYIVPIDRIESVRNKIIIIKDEEIPIGNTYEENFFNLFRK